MKRVVLFCGCALTSLLPLLPLPDLDDPCDKVFAAQMAGLVIIAMVIVNLYREET